MIEKIVLDYLANALDVPVYMEMPEEPPKRFIRLEKTGSGETNLICSSTFAVQSYAPTLYEAARLNQDVKIVMHELDAVKEVCRCSLNSDYNFTDTETQRYRYQAVFDIVHY